MAKIDGKIDPAALFLAFSIDYGRQTMAGQTGSASPVRPPSAAPAFPASSTPPADDDFARDDPRRDLLRTQATRAQLELDRELGKTVPAEEAAAAMAEAIAELRAAMLQAAREDAARLLADLKAPGHMTGIAVAALKRYAAKGQEAFARRAAQALDPSTPKGMSARARLDALVALDLQLRSEAPEDEPPPVTQPAAAPPSETAQAISTPCSSQS
jgi:hypothetical protein